MKDSLQGNSLSHFELEVACCRDINPDFFKIFDEKFFQELKNLKILKFNFSDNSVPPEIIDVKFLQNLAILQKLEKLNLNLSRNHIHRWKKFCRVLPTLKKLMHLKLNFYGIALPIDYLSEICNCVIKCDGLESIKIDFRASNNWVQSQYDWGRDITYIDSLISVFRQKFENDPKKLRIWF